MYRGFNLKLSDTRFEAYAATGRTIYTQSKVAAKGKLDQFLKANGRLDGKAMQQNWFPQLEAQVFLSHSHADEEIAIGLAGWLYKHFELRTFIDSSVWGYCDQLLKEIDNNYCKSEDGVTYNYEKRNRSTSHVHMMLNTALTMMMDRTECLIFLNSPHSVNSQELANSGKTQTASPWIYSEIATSQLIRVNEPHRFSTRAKLILDHFEKGVSSKFLIDHELSLKHLRDLHNYSLVQWLSKSTGRKKEQALDILYNLNPPPDYGKTS